MTYKRNLCCEIAIRGSRGRKQVLVFGVIMLRSSLSLFLFDSGNLWHLKNVLGTLCTNKRQKTMKEVKLKFKGILRTAYFIMFIRFLSKCMLVSHMMLPVTFLYLTNFRLEFKLLGLKT